MRNVLLLFVMMICGMSFGNEMSNKILNEPKQIYLVTIENTESEAHEMENTAFESFADCYEVASAVLEAALQSNMLINEAYDAAYAVYQTCEAIQMM